ncbi:hypothetical protein P8452_16248 [Trifolium repens]|nr:hypothetical protein P8452_16248 [Trifolium repens]
MFRARKYRSNLPKPNPVRLDHSAQVERPDLRSNANYLAKPFPYGECTSPPTGHRPIVTYRDAVPEHRSSEIVGLKI